MGNPSNPPTTSENKKQRKRPEKVPLSMLPLRHRFMFNTVFKNKELLKAFLECLLGIKIERIELHVDPKTETTDSSKTSGTDTDVETIISVETEKTVEDQYGYKAVRFDVYVTGSKRIITIEMQAQGRKDDPLPQRGRIYQVALDRSLKDGEHYNATREFYVIFLCDYEPSKSQDNGYAKYTRVSHFEENNESAEDGYHLIVLNTRYKQDDKHKNVPAEMLELLDYIRTGNDTMVCQGDIAKLAIQGVLAARNDSKVGGNYVKYMTLTWGEQQDILDEGADLYDSCIDLVGAGLSDEKIAEQLGYELPVIQKTIDKVRARLPFVTHS